MNVQIKERIAEIEQGKVPKGYKKVLSSIVCEDYIETTFGELFDFYGGLGIPRDQLSDNGYPYLHYGDMHRESFTKVSVEQYNELPKYDIKLSGNETFLLEDGDVVFLDASEDLEGTSRSVMVDNPENAPFISGLHTFIAKEKHDTLAKDYKQYITMTDYVKKQFMKLASGFKVYGLNRNSIKDIVFTYPQDKQEQQKIAEILMKWDEAIALQEKLIEKLELQKRALIQRLLTPKGNWISTTLDKVLKSGSKTAVADTSKYQKITIKLDLKGLEFTEVKREMADTRPFYVRKKGEIIIGKQNYFNGSIAIVSDEFDGCICSNAIMSFNVINSDVFYVFNYISQPNFLRKYENLANGTGQKELSEKDFLSFELKLPSIEHQRYISKIIGTSVSHLSLQIKKLNEMKLQQRSLMQLLLTGIVRVSE